MRSFYSGTRYGKAGHHVYEYPERRPLRHPYGQGFVVKGMPWPYLDSRRGHLYPSVFEGEAKLTHKDGWTALGFSNYTDDKRGNSNSVFAFDAELPFEQALAAARRYFPDVWEAIKFEVRLSPTAEPSSSESVNDSTRLS